MGYSKLELAGYGKGAIGGVPMMDFKKMAEDAGLKIISSHVNPVDTSISDPFKAMIFKYSKEVTPKIMEYWKATAADHAKLGCKYLIQPMMPTITTHDEAKLVVISSIRPRMLSRQRASPLVLAIIIIIWSSIVSQRKSNRRK